MTQSSNVAEKWNDGVASEVYFWRNWFLQKGGAWPEDYSARLDELRPFDRNVERLLPLSTPRRLRILDVGAGPITCLGYKSQRFDIDIIATDALANYYDEIMHELNINPPVRTVLCRAEELESKFQVESFEVVHSRNALDHCIDPRGAILSMCRLVRRSGLVHILVYRNEGQKEKYRGLHNWNFDLQNNSLILWREGENYNMSELCAPFGRVVADGNDRQLTFSVYRD